MIDSQEFDVKSNQDVSDVDNKEASDVFFNPFINVSNIDPNAIPKIPYPKFLSRDKHDTQNLHDMAVRAKQSKVKHNYYITKNGQKIRGRGAMRYDRRYLDNEQNNRDTERSTTPPHWRYEQSKLIKLSQVELKLLEPKNFLKAFERNSSSTQNGIDLKANDSDNHIETNMLKHSVESRILKVDRRNNQSNNRNQYQSSYFESKSKWVKNSEFKSQFESIPKSDSYRNRYYYSNERRYRSRSRDRYRSRSRDRYYKSRKSENKFVFSEVVKKTIE